MTTLGFGDIHAGTSEAEWAAWAGHVLLTIQVLLGYFMLGVLITRLAILFQSPGAPTDHRDEKYGTVPSKSESQSTP